MQFDGCPGKRGEFHNGDTESLRDDVLRQQRPRLQAGEAGRGKERSSTRNYSGSMALLTPQCHTSDLWNLRDDISAALNHPVCGILLQQS